MVAVREQPIELRTVLRKRQSVEEPRLNVVRRLGPHDQIRRSGDAVDEEQQSRAVGGHVHPIYVEHCVGGPLKACFTHSRQIIFYCHSGRRAGLAAALARELGYQSANMGGYADWVEAGLPTRQP